LSPEQIRHLPYGLKVDIWGLGCVLYKLCALDPPFLGENLNILGQNIVIKSFKSLPPKFTPKLVSFITNLLEKNPKSRPNILEVIDQIPVFTKKFYKTPVFLERVLEKKPEEIEKLENLEKPKKTEKLEKIGKPDRTSKQETQIKPESKPDIDHKADKSEKSVKKIEEIPSSETILPRFSHLVFDRSMQGTLKRLVFNEQRPISQGTNRLVGASSDAVRLSTAYVRQRILKDDKPKTTISDLARIV
jgi:serine/threonine protein kinase